MEWLLPLSARENAKLTSILVEHTRKGLERKGWEVLGFQNGAMKRYSMTLVHHGQKCSFVAYLLDENNPFHIFVSTPLPVQVLPRINEPRQAGGTYQSTRKLPELPSSAMDRIKSVICYRGTGS